MKTPLIEGKKIRKRMHESGFRLFGRSTCLSTRARNTYLVRLGDEVHAEAEDETAGRGGGIPAVKLHVVKLLHAESEKNGIGLDAITRCITLLLAAVCKS